MSVNFTFKNYRSFKNEHAAEHGGSFIQELSDAVVKSCDEELLL